MYDHLNYARTGPGAARGIEVLRGEVTDVNDEKGIVSVRIMGANHYQTVRFYFGDEDGNWKNGQAVEMTIASFDA
jgi:hypothetical protein